MYDIKYGYQIQLYMSTQTKLFNMKKSSIEKGKKKDLTEEEKRLKKIFKNLLLFESKRELDLYKKIKEKEQEQEC